MIRADHWSHLWHSCLATLALVALGVPWAFGWVLLAGMIREAAQWITAHSPRAWRFATRFAILRWAIGTAEWSDMGFNLAGVTIAQILLPLAKVFS